jgi:hypothetical protein
VLVLICALVGHWSAAASEAGFSSANLPRNAGFELGDTFNGFPMRPGTEPSPLSPCLSQHNFRHCPGTLRTVKNFKKSSCDKYKSV